MLGRQCGRGGGTRRAYQRRLNAGQRIARCGVVQNLDCRRAGKVAGPVDREARYPFDAALLHLAAEMSWQGDDAGGGVVRVVKKAAVGVYRSAGGVETVCRLDGFENSLSVTVDCTLNCRARNNVEDRSGCQGLFACEHPWPEVQ